MTPERFQEVVEEQLDNIRNTLVIKAKEYSRNNDPLHNFNVGTKQSVTGETREEVIWGMARKHWISIQDIRADIKAGKLPSKATLDEKFGDMLVYLLIEKASIINKIENHGE